MAHATAHRTCKVTHDSSRTRRRPAVATVVFLALLSTRAGAAAESDQPTTSPAANSSRRNFYVNHETGDDRFTGLAPQTSGADGPVKSIRAALRQARPGDTIHLAPLAIPYRDIVVLHNLRGEPGRPITIDGHGATVTGAEPLDSAACKEVGPGLFRADGLIPPKLVTPEDAVSRRWFFLFDGRMNRMGRTLKGKNAPYKKPAELEPSEWTYQRDENAFYIKIDPAKTLGDYRIEWPQRGAGVQMSGDCSQLVVRNLIATHVYNDGYNIHGKSARRASKTSRPSNAATTATAPTTIAKRRSMDSSRSPTEPASPTRATRGPRSKGCGSRIALVMSCYSSMKAIVISRPRGAIRNRSRTASLFRRRRTASASTASRGWSAVPRDA